jgi:predicted Zn finger-like uncharacterized protein
MIEVQCTSCHTRYRIDEQVLPEGLPTFKCSRCGHVFSCEPRKSRPDAPAMSETQPSFAGKPSSAAPPAESSSPNELNVQNEDDARQETAHDAFPPGGSLPPSTEPIPGDGAAASSEPPSPAAKPAEQSAHNASRTAGESAGAPQSEVSPQQQARQAEQFYSRLLADKKPDSQPDENLSFDFAEEEPAFDEAKLASQNKRRAEQPPREAARFSDEWAVGDEEAPVPDLAPVEPEQPPAETPLSAPGRKRGRSKTEEPQFGAEANFVDESQAPVYNRAATHSARFFLTLVLLVGIAFGVITMLIHNAPASAAVLLGHLPFVGERFALPVTPARLVALRDVSAAYQRSKDAHTALVITGTAENVGMNPLGTVQLSAALRDSEHRSLASRAVYCGNDLSATMIGQMTPHEIEFFQKLEPSRAFNLQPLASCRFVVVFIDPPSALSSYDVSVSQAVPEGAQNTPEPAA